ncbi:MAG: Uma2 family endonuclease [Thiothrix sp.]|uniref:Uma2 family endonuclease n=1 Tax=Thiothrix sp. TaxID=1032 RepID=UPI00261C9D87|nr:Uma2 family endonuclease [Thiothrix sp.]MDD5394737.1 Uma2 family endonuclease [Thiothrix sp.]
MSTATLLEIEDKLITADELYAMGDMPGVELIKGKLRNMSPTGYEHGATESDIAFHLKSFLRQHNLGKVMTGEVGVYIRRNPDSIRAADVLFISHQRLQQVQSKSYLDVAPELVVEVLSPRDSWVDMAEKLEEYFSIGVLQVWFANPRNKTLQVFTSATDSVLLRGDDCVSEIAFLPGFSLNVSEIYS